MSTSLCPCGSNRAYADCCEPLHRHTQVASSAEQLMRSRYSAYALGLVDYIVATTLPAQQPVLDREGIAAWASSCTFTGLEILDTRAGQPGDLEGQVEFVAYFRLHNVNDVQKHQERSSFRFRHQRWFFVDPTVGKPPERNAPCPCGRGPKYKKCCA